MGNKRQSQWLCDAEISTWPIFVFKKGHTFRCPIWVWGDIPLAKRICRLLNESEMTKKERRQLLKQIYPAVCEGDEEALAEFDRLIRVNKRNGKCFVCGKTIHTEKRPGEDTRCQPHRKSNCCMKQPKSLKA